MMTTRSNAACRTLVALLCVALVGSGCATMHAGPAGRSAAPLGPADRAVLADYVQRLPPGTAVRVERVRGGAVRGTLMKAGADTIIVQPRTRLPEPPIEIPLDQVLAVTPHDEARGRIGTAIAAGVAAGAGAALATFFILLAIFAD